MEMTTKTVEYPQLDNPTQLHEQPPGYDAQQCPVATEPQPVQVNAPGYGGQQCPVATQQQPVQVVHVIQQQPRIIYGPHVHVPSCSTLIKSHFFFSAICIIVGAVFVWPVLFCAIPAFAFSLESKNRFVTGDSKSGTKYGRIALGFNLAALIFFILIIIAYIVIFNVLL